MLWINLELGARRWYKPLSHYEPSSLFRFTDEVMGRCWAIPDTHGGIIFVCVYFIGTTVWRVPSSCKYHMTLAIHSHGESGSNDGEGAPWHLHIGILHKYRFTLNHLVQYASLRNQSSELNTKFSVSEMHYFILFYSLTITKESITIRM